jgi:hypothetical protein
LNQEGDRYGVEEAGAPDDGGRHPANEDTAYEKADGVGDGPGDVVDGKPAWCREGGLDVEDGGLQSGPCGVDEEAVA